MLRSPHRPRARGGLGCHAVAVPSGVGPRNTPLGRPAPACFHPGYDSAGRQLRHACVPKAHNWSQSCPRCLSPCGGRLATPRRLSFRLRPRKAVRLGAAPPIRSIRTGFREELETVRLEVPATCARSQPVDPCPAPRHGYPGTTCGGRSDWAASAREQRPATRRRQFGHPLAEEARADPASIRPQA
jgi:hypothetical protein